MIKKKFDQTKILLYKSCQDLVKNRLETIQKTINSNKVALESETKSSAGDKHETGRAMLQLEIEKAGKQFSSIQNMMRTLQLVNLEKSDTIRLGSLIITNKGNYFLATSVGIVQIDNKDFYVVSTSSPIGQLLLGKKKGMSIFFNNEIKIIDVC